MNGAAVTTVGWGEERIIKTFLIISFENAALQVLVHVWRLSIFKLEFYFSKVTLGDKS